MRTAMVNIKMSGLCDQILASQIDMLIGEEYKR